MATLAEPHPPARPVVVASRAPDPRVMRFANPVVSAVLRSPLHRLVSGRVFLLTVTGRLSGRRFTLPLGYVRDGDALLVVSQHAAQKRWWRNLRGGAPVALHLRGHRVTGRAEVIETPLALAAEIERLIARLGPKEASARLYMGLDTPPRPTREQLARALGGVVLVRVVPDGPGGSTAALQPNPCPSGRRSAWVRRRMMFGRFLRWRTALPVVAVLFAAYLAALHPWLITWGATAEERQMALLGDEAPPSAYVTRAITIDAPPSAVWPWLVQMGQDRAGFYSNSWLENLTGADIHNADTIHPEWQQRAVGDSVPLARPDLLFGLGAWGRTPIVILEPERAIGDIVGRFVLLPTGDGAGGGTRLLFRESLASQGPAAQASGAVRVLVWDPAHFVMVRRVLEDIKERAEGRPLVPGGLQLAARVGWLVAGAGLLGLFARRRRRWPWLIAPVAALTPPYLASGDPDATLAGFLAIGITLAGSLAFGRRWWPAYLLVAAAVAWVLLLAPDAYAAFGLLFLLAALALLAAALRRGLRPPQTQAGGLPANAHRAGSVR